MDQRMKVVLGMYTTRDGVQFAVEAFRDAGFKNSDISVVLPENMPVEELGVPARKEGEIPTHGRSKPVDTPRSATVLEKQEESLLIVGSMAEALGGAARECSPEELEVALAMMGIPECDTEGYAYKILRGEALLSVHCENAEMAAAARGLHGDLGGMDVFTARQTEPIIGELYRTMAFSGGH